MKISSNKKNTILPMSKVKDGAVFRYRDNIYIRFGGKSNTYNCLLLENGVLGSIDQCTEVELLDAELIIN